MLLHVAIAVYLAIGLFVAVALFLGIGVDGHLRYRSLGSIVIAFLFVRLARICDLPVLPVTPCP